MEIFDPATPYYSSDDSRILSLIKLIRDGIKFDAFLSFANKIPFTIAEWSGFLHISLRTMQRYQKENLLFDPLQSEKIVEIALLHKKGTEVFGNADKFNLWVDTVNLALGNIKPKSMLDSSFGINLIKDELGRIEYGILS